MLEIYHFAKRVVTVSVLLESTVVKQGKLENKWYMERSKIQHFKIGFKYFGKKEER